MIYKIYFFYVIIKASAVIITFLSNKINPRLYISIINILIKLL